MKTVIKIDDALFDIKKEKELVATKIDDDEIMETILLDEGFEKLIENDINHLANEAYEELKKEFKDNLKTNVLQVVGFTPSRWGSRAWEVDHCNGRHSAITELISDKVKQLFRDELDALLKEDVEKMIKKLKPSLMKELKENFIREARDQISNIAQNSAKEFCKSVVSQEMVKFQQKAFQKAKLAFLGSNTVELEETDE